ncbi:MAG TPA: sortase, partial [Methanobacterium sp.]|nr:sortase [Methanobacterium sp.]
QRKKFVYQVTSNGDDIRWDYKTNPIRFSQEGEARLLIVTCYPPGRKQAAWITHFKLVSSSDF